MRILFHCVYFPPEVGGLESHVYYLARALVDRGNTVDVVTSRSQPGIPDQEVMDGIQVWRTWFPSRTPAGWIAHSLASVPKTRALAKAADVIHAQAFASVLPAASGRRRSGAPLVATFHTSHFLVRAESGLWRPILGKLVRLPDYCLAASEEIAEVAMALAPGTKVEPLANGVETSLFRPVPPLIPKTDRKRLVVPRRLFPKNGVEHFVRALPIILEEMDVEALFIGDGPERERLEALASELGIGDRVEFLGKRRHEEMPGLLCSGDLAVIPSLMEATSVAALEAMACERPVAASNVGGLPEIVDDAVGGLFEPGDPKDLARAVLELLAGGGLERRGAAARDRVKERWSNDRLAARHLEIYSDLLSGRA
ncbi:MAG: glycosyltransferase family 4 protein [Gemmatimonadetes bacterium]|nr:glycosyltransferase family 4 protein [Gemmatimonadota bacterium]NNM04804.1 glycosyltransferase family 4 protein [Gemmatimonadota bacterium]